MSSKYAPRLSVPDGFNYVLRDFTREVLRNQPSNIYQFGAAYFEDRLEESRRPPPTPKDLSLSVEEIESILNESFNRVDQDNSGYLHHQRFAAVLAEEVRLQLNERQLQRLMADAAENDYGMVVYKDTTFIRTAAEVIKQMLSQPPLPDILSTAPVDVILGRCLLRDDFDRMMLDCFNDLDEHKTGMMNRAELRRALDLCAVGFTQKEVNMLMYAAEEDKNGMIMYSTYRPKCFDIIRNYNTDSLDMPLPTPEEWESSILDVLRAYDSDNAKTLHCNEIRSIMLSSDFGLTHLQVYDLLSEVEEDENGFITYEDFASLGAQSLANQYDVEAAVNQAKYMRTHAAVDVGEHSINGALALSFASGGEDFMRGDVKQILLDDTAMRLSQREINGLMAMVEEDEDGYAICSELLRIGYDVLKFLAFQDHLRSRDWSTPPFRAIVTGGGDV